MPEKTPLIAFDFDGVICNSIHDSLLTAINAFCSIEPEKSFPLEKICSKEIFNFEKSNPDFFYKFNEMMPLGNFAEDYYVFIKIILNEDYDKISGQDDFDSYKKLLNPEILERYSLEFYKYRRNLQTNTPDEWAALLPIYDGIDNAVKILHDKAVLAISTSKDLKSVNLLLDKYGLSSFFQKKNILDKDYAESKKDQLLALHAENDIPLKNIHFVDDKALHIIAVKDLNINKYLAAWGFNGKREAQIALKNGAVVLNIEDLATII